MMANLGQVNVPDDLLYSTDHEWVRVDGDVATVGITDYAQDALGDVVFVNVPAVGLQVTAGQSFSEVESTKSVSDIYAPVGGSITAVNESLDQDPQLLNTDPYGAGWICAIQIADREELGSLLDASAYRALIGE
jgi:glycine cleavage system H protein